VDLVESAASVTATTVRHPWETARLAILRRLLARHAPIHDRALVVDVGCGDAFVIGSLADAFPGATFGGVDSALTASIVNDIHRRTQRSNLVLSDSLDTLAIPRGIHASAVLLMDVIEHVPDDVEFLRDLLRRDFVGPESTFIVTVPAYPSLFSAHDVFLHHYRRYSMAGLRETLTRAGLRMIEGGHLFASLLPIRLAEVARERAFGRRALAATALAAPPALGRGLITAALVADASASLWLQRIGIALPGLSAFAVCRKSA
jgi:hypothetical protein